MLTFHLCLTLRRNKKKALLNKQAPRSDQVLDGNVLQCLALYKVNSKLDKEYLHLVRIIPWQVQAVETILQVLNHLTLMVTKIIPLFHPQTDKNLWEVL